jgi:hypothetical protein
VLLLTQIGQAKIWSWPNEGNNKNWPVVGKIYLDASHAKFCNDNEYGVIAIIWLGRVGPTSRWAIKDQHDSFVGRPLRGRIEARRGRVSR